MNAPGEIVEKLRLFASNYDGVSELARGQKGGLIGALDNAFGTSVLRRRFLAWVFLDDVTQELSTKNLTPAQWYALWKWVDFFKDDGVWYKSTDFLVEAEILRAHLGEM